MCNTVGGTNMAGIGKCVAIMAGSAFVCGTTLSAVGNARAKKALKAQLDQAVQNGGMSQIEVDQVMKASNKRAGLGSVISGLFAAAVTAGISALTLLVHSKFFKVK
ncbi:hypothetical protein J6S88_02450 [bacterium]|nr:hypothetical protein [bacterium]